MIDNKQKRTLKSLAHGLKPVVLVGKQALTPTLVSETEQALLYHELIKVKFRVGERELYHRLLDKLCELTGAELVQRVGNIGVLYKANNEKPQIKL